VATRQWASAADLYGGVCVIDNLSARPRESGDPEFYGK
jgi:hypothetical protein